MMKNLLPFALALGVAISMPAMAQKTAIPPMAQALTYADVADLSLAARIVAQVRIRKASPIAREQTISATPGRKRFLIDAEVIALIRGDSGIAQRIRYLVDVPLDWRGRPPKLKKAEMILFAQPVSERAGEVRLVTPDAQVTATADMAARVRSILGEAARDAAPPIVTGIGNAFHTAGTIEGDGESQIFLTTRDGRPVSLSVLRSQSVTPSWSVSLGELVDQGGGPPARDSLLWYRLACFLPATLPGTSISGLSDEDAAAVARDYQLIRTGLGACPRTLTIRP